VFNLWKTVNPGKTRTSPLQTATVQEQ